MLGLLAPATAQDQAALPSWNEGEARQRILDSIRATTDITSTTFVPPEERIATFDQDGTLWLNIRSTHRRSIV